MTAPTAGSVAPEAVVIVYEPEGGFATDGGFFNSPAGALTADQSWVHGVVGSAVELQAVVAGIPGTASAAATLPPRCALASIRRALGRTAVLGDRSGVVAATANTRPRATRNRLHTASMRIGPRCMPRL
jgi:hypothetical protein